MSPTVTSSTSATLLLTTYLVTIEAENEFDFQSRLREIQAPTLVIVVWPFGNKEQLVWKYLEADDLLLGCMGAKTHCSCPKLFPSYFEV